MIKRENLGRVGILAGGPSNEREISLRSGRAVYNALIAQKIDATFFDVRHNIHDIIKSGAMDVAFIALHGRFGEDGTVQKILEDAHIPYTGSGVEASRLSLDKVASKHIFEKNGIPVPKYIICEKGEVDIDSIFRLGLPLVVKPQFEGSSIGLAIVKERAALGPALDKAFVYGEKVLAEEFIEGRELTVGILDDEPLAVIEIVTKDHVYDYTAKYNAPETRYLVPAPIGKAAFEKAQALAKRAHDLLGCAFFSRVDMMMDKNDDIFVLEVNTIPGMTERSLLPKAAQVKGLNFNQLCVKIIESALRKKESVKI